MRTRIIEYQKELELVTGDRLRLEQEYSVLQNHLHTLRAESDEKDASLTKLEELLSQRCAQVLQLEECVRRTDERHAKETSRLLSANEQLQSRIAQHEESTTRRPSKESELAEAQSKILSLEQRMCQLTAEAKQSRIAYVAETDQLRKTIQLKEQENRDGRRLDLSFENRVAGQEQASKAKRIELLSSEVLQLKAENEKLTEFIHGLQKESAKDPQTDQELERAYETIHELTVELGKLAERSQKEKEKFEEFRRGYGELERKADLLDRELEGLRVAYQGDQADKCEQERYLQETKRENAKLRQELSEMKEMNSHLYGSMDTLHMNRSCESWEERLEDKGSMETLLKLRERENGELRESLKAECEKYQKLLESSTAEFDSLMGLNCELSEKLLSCSEELEVLKGHRQPLEQSSIRLKSASKSSKNTVNPLGMPDFEDAVREDAALFGSETASENRELKDSIRSLKRQIESMEDDIRFERRRNDHLEAIFTKVPVRPL